MLDGAPCPPSIPTLCASNGAKSVPRDQELLVGWDDPDRQLRGVRRYAPLRAADHTRIRFVVELHASPAELATHARPDLGRIFPDAAREDDRVGAVERGEIRADVL